MGWREYADLYCAGRHRLKVRPPVSALPAAVLVCSLAASGLVACSVNDHDLPLHNLEPLQGAALIGTLLMDGDCLFVVADDGTTYGVAWPSGRTTWDPASQVLRVGQDEARVGDRLAVGGVGRDVSGELMRSIDWAQRPMDECLGDRLWLAIGLTTDLSDFE